MTALRALLPTAARAAAALAAAVTLVLAQPGPAQAHNELVRATPANGSTWKQLPESGTLTFAETLEPGDLEVQVGGTVLPLTPIRGNPRAMTYSLAGVEGAPTVVVTWTVVDSHDGHRSGGSLRLHVTGAAAARTAPDETRAEDVIPKDTEPALLHWLDLGSRIAGFVGLVVLVGGLVFLSLLWPDGARDRRARRLLVGSVGTGLVAAAGSVGAVVWRTSAQPVSEALATDYGRAATSAVLVWLLAAVVVAGVLQLDATAVRGVAWRLGAIVVSAGLVRLAGINAHATQGEHQTLGALAGFLHLVAVSAWAGGLVMLSVCLLPRAELEQLEHVVPGFSRVAQASVVTIVGSGLLLLWDISRGIDGFWETHYAHVLVLKLSFFSLVILAAMKSKRWVESALADVVTTHRRTAVRSFAVSVAAETVLVIAVLAAAGVLVTSSPGQ